MSNYDFEPFSDVMLPVARRLCLVCAIGRVPGWSGDARLMPSPCVAGCGCRPVCVSCLSAVGGWLERLPCLLCGDVCGAAGCSPLVAPRQPLAPGEPGGSVPPALQWLRPLRSGACGDARHPFADVPEGVVAGFGELPFRCGDPSPSPSASSKASDPEWSPGSPDGSSDDSV